MHEAMQRMWGLLFSSGYFSPTLPIILMKRLGSRSEMHEATRRLLGVLLRHVDGFIADKRSVVIGVTKRSSYNFPYIRFTNFFSNPFFNFTKLDLIYTIF